MAILVLAALIRLWHSFRSDTCRLAPIKPSPPPPQNSHPSLKRHRSPSLTMSSAPLPPLPKLVGEIILDVFTHRSLRFPGAPTNEDSEYGDNDRLAVLGEKVLDAAVTDVLFRKRPMLKATDIEVCFTIRQTDYELLSHVMARTQSRKKEILYENIEKWITGYKLRDKLRCRPDVVDTLGDREVRRPCLFSWRLSNDLTGNVPPLQLVRRRRLRYSRYGRRSQLGRWPCRSRFRTGRPAAIHGAGPQR